MAEDAPEKEGGQTAETVSPGQRPRPTARWWPTARRRLVELLIVFVGVYSAFLLNRYDTYRRDEQRRRLILDALEREIRGNVQEMESDIGVAEPQLAGFERQLADHEMPHLGIVMTNPSYDASDDATLLAAGGLELLDVPSIELLRKINNMQRVLTASAHNEFELSLAELANHSSADFYDPATKELKPSYSWYPYVLRDEMKQAKAILEAEKELLGHIHAEQHPGAPVGTLRSAQTSTKQ